MTGSNCPSRERLFHYTVGRLSDDDSDALASHLDACSSCRSALVTLNDVDDSLVARLRCPLPGDPLLAEPECGVALARARAAAGQAAAANGRPAPRGEGPFPVPGQLGEYQLLEQLGHGGMGTVYKALHTKLDRVVALKVLAKGRVEDERAIARFEREMKVIGRLDHPHIVRAHDAREIDGRPVLVMEYVEGLDLARLVGRAGSLRVPDACELARQVAVGLQYVHEHGLVHRDIKPSNLMLTPQGEVKILDLGLACFHRERGGSDSMTGTGQTMGTADYMAPEQTSDSRGVDIRADLYSLGCTLFKLLCGCAPFEGPNYRGAFDKMTAHVQTPAPSIRQWVADVPEALAALLGRMLAKDPAERPASPAEVAGELEAFCAGHDLPSLARSAVRRKPSPPQPGTRDQRVCGPLPWGRGKRTRLLLGLIGLVVVLGLAWDIFLHIRHHDADTALQVPDGSDVRIGEDGRVDVTPPKDTGREKQKPAAAVPSDERAIQGTWKIVSSSLELCRFPLGEDGREVRAPADVVQGTTRVVITADTFKILGDHVVGEAFQYKLNAAARPRMIDLLSGGRAALGIYELRGNRLRICTDEAPGRPAEFWADLGSRKDLLVLERVGDAAVEPDERLIQGTWEVFDCSSGQPTGIGYSPLMAATMMFLQGQTLTITRHTLGPGGEDDPDYSAGPRFGMGGNMAGGFGGGMGSGGMGGIYPWATDMMGFGKAWGYALDPAGRPKSIDLVSASGTVLLGIYDLSGDGLKICVGPERPKQLALGPDDRAALVTLRRVTGSGRRRSPRLWPGAEDYASRSGRPKPPRPLAVDVDRGGTATIAGMPVEDGQLQILVGLLLGDDPRRQVRLRCDADLPFSRAADLLEVLTAAGLPRSSVLLETAQTPAARLDFRIAATRGNEPHESSPTEAEIKRYLEDLRDHGPTFVQAARAKALRIARQNAVADLIGSLEGIDKASVRIDTPPEDGGQGPPSVRVSVAVQSLPAGPLDEALRQTVQDLVATAVPGVDAGAVEVVEAGAQAAADSKAADSKPAPAAHASGARYAWFELAAEAPTPAVTAEYEDRRYVLLSVRPEDTMVAGDEGPRQWRIADASLAEGADGGPTLCVTLDAAGARRMAALSEAHLGQFLAILIDGRAVCLPRIQSTLAEQIEITGHFDARQAQRLLRGLLGPFAGKEANSPPEEEDRRPPPATGGGFF